MRCHDMLDGEQNQGKDQVVARARRRSQRHLQSDRLGSMTGSQATAGLRGGEARDKAQLFLPAARRPGLNRRARKVGLTSVATGRCAGVGEEGGAVWPGAEQR
jgi:hypothetical protein